MVGIADGVLYEVINKLCDSLLITVDEYRRLGCVEFDGQAGIFFVELFNMGFHNRCEIQRLHFIIKRTGICQRQSVQVFYKTF